MKQHPIPQNILDIEFKLFTKFTIREFVYIAVGIGFGGIFLYLYTSAIISGIIAFPIFLVSSGIGLFLGLVPINDQKADVFLTNYIRAIRRPTLRVWKNKEFDEKVEGLANEQGLTLTTQGTLNREETEDKAKGKIIGGAATAVASNQFIEKQELETLDQEEEERIRKFEQLDQVVNSQMPTPSAPEPEPKARMEVDEELRVKNDVQEVELGVMNQKPTQTVTITKETILPYAIDIEGLNILPASLNMQLVDREGNPVAQSTVMVKDRNGSLIQVLQSTQDGLVLANKSYQPGEYSVEIKHDLYTFPVLYYILENEVYPAIRITAL